MWLDWGKLWGYFIWIFSCLRQSDMQVEIQWREGVSQREGQMQRPWNNNELRFLCVHFEYTSWLKDGEPDREEAAMMLVKVSSSQILHSLVDCSTSYWRYPVAGRILLEGISFSLGVHSTFRPLSWHYMHTVSYSNKWFFCPTTKYSLLFLLHMALWGKTKGIQVG